MVGSDLKRVADDVFNLERIRELIELMKQHELSEIDLRRDKHQIRLARNLSTGGIAGIFPNTAIAQSAIPGAAPHENPQPATAANTATINSPMVGTFYSRPNPDAETFVKIGDIVGSESIVCIVEAMKVFNEIPADVAGKIVAMLVKDQDAVEFGTPLFQIEPTG